MNLLVQVTDVTYDPKSKSYEMCCGSEDSNKVPEGEKSCNASIEGYVESVEKEVYDEEGNVVSESKTESEADTTEE